VEYGLSSRSPQKVRLLMMDELVVVRSILCLGSRRKDLR